MDRTIFVGWWRASALAGAVALVSGCTVHPFVIHLWWGGGSLNKADQALFERVGFAAGVSFDEAADPTTAYSATSQPARFSTAALHTQAAAVSITPYTIDRFYAGPFPSASQLAAGWSPKPVGGWLTVNPLVTHTCTTTTTETYWSPGGDTTSTPSYTLRVVGNASDDDGHGHDVDDAKPHQQGDDGDERDGDHGQHDKDHHKILTALYATPNVPAQLPNYFGLMLSLPAQTTTVLAEETYHVYSEGSIAGTALGYRWAVTDPTEKLLAWIRAFQVTASDGSKIDRYVLDENYQPVKGVTRPLHYGYDTFYEATGIGQQFDQVLDPASGTWTGKGAYVDLRKGDSVAFTETLPGAGGATRVYTYTDPSQTIVTTENYQPNGSGTGTVVVGGSQKATMQWGKDGKGTITFSSGTQPYQASIKPPAPPSASTCPSDGKSDNGVGNGGVPGAGGATH